MASRLYLSFRPVPIQSIRATRCTSSVALMASKNVSSQTNSILHVQQNEQVQSHL